MHALHERLWITVLYAHESSHESVETETIANAQKDVLEFWKYGQCFLMLDTIINETTCVENTYSWAAKHEKYQVKAKL